MRITRGSARSAALRLDQARSRLFQEAGKRVDRVAGALGIDPAANELKNSAGRPRPGRYAVRTDSAPELSPGRFFFSAGEVDAILSLLRERFPRVCEEAVGRAERLCRHEFDFLGRERLNFGSPIDWQFDPINAARTAQVPWYKIRDGGSANLKVIWALNRHQHLVTLAKAHLLTRSPQFLTELLDQWHAWIKENPYPLGVNWSSGAEVAMRSLSWLWTGHLLSASPAAPKSFQYELLRGLATSARHVERYLGSGLAAGNLLSQAVALFFTGVLCPKLRSAQRWRELGWRLIIEEAERCVAPGGPSYTASLSDEVQTLEFFIRARILASRNQIAVPAPFDQAIRNALAFLAGASQAGLPPRWGGENTEIAASCPERLLDPLSTGAALYGDADCKAAVSALAEETVWLLGATGASDFDAVESRPAPAASGAFPERGFYIMAGARPSRSKQSANGAGAQQRIQLALAAPPEPNPGKRAGALSIQLSVDGEQWLVDSAVAPLTQATSLHANAESVSNTLVVDEVSQAAAYCPAQAKVWIAGPRFDIFEGSRTANEDRADPVTHQRTVVHLKAGFWFVRDRVDGRGQRHLGLSWQFSPAFSPHYTPPGFTFTRDGVGESLTGLSIVPAEGHGWSQEVARGYVASPSGEPQTAPVLRFETRVVLPAEFAVVLHPVEKSDSHSRRLVRGESERVVCYHYQYPGARYLLLLSAQAGVWELGGWRSDARFVVASAEGREGAPQTVICQGSFLDVDGQSVLTCDRPVEWCEAADGCVTSSDAAARLNFDPNVLSAALRPGRTLQSRNSPHTP